MSSMPIVFDLPTVGFLVLVGLLMPQAAWQGYLKLKRGDPLPPKIKRFRVMILALLMVVTWALMAADSNDVRLRYNVTLPIVLLGIATSALLLKAVARGWPKVEAARRERVLKLYGAENLAQLRWLLAGGLCAGIGEEIVYRGVLFALASRLTGSVLAGMLISIVLFALAHTTQGLKSTIVVGLLGLLFHLFCLLTGSLISAMIVHTIYDIGIFLRFYRELRLVKAAEAQDAIQTASAATN